MNPVASVPRAGVIGLGMIGGGVATCLAREGLLAASYDIRPDAASAHPGLPPPCGSPADVGLLADVILIAVVSAAQVRAVLDGANGLLSVARPGQSLMVLSTVSGGELAELRSLTGDVGVALVDCGVVGGAVAAQKGLVSLVGATVAEMDRVRPIVEGFSKKVIHAGPPGAGMALKVAFNVTVFGLFHAAREAATLTESLGLDVDQLGELMEASSAVFGRPGLWLRPPTNASDRQAREAVLTFLDKDLDAALAYAEAQGVELPGARLARDDGRAILGIS